MAMMIVQIRIFVARIGSVFDVKMRVALTAQRRADWNVALQLKHVVMKATWGKVA